MGHLGEDRAPPSHAAGGTYFGRDFAEGISDAMNVLAMSTGALALGVLVMLGLTWRYRWGAKPLEVPRDPPYR